MEKSEQLSEEEMQTVVEELHSKGEQNDEESQAFIESFLLKLGKIAFARSFIEYCIRHTPSKTDQSILDLVKTKNKEVGMENSNKNPMLLATQRDLIAGEVSKDLSKRFLLPEYLVKAHEDGVIHFHDMDYFVQDMFNCCLVNISDMLDNGTVMNNKLIESPKSFQVACTVMTQIIAANCGGQYGGQSVNIKHLGKYLKKTEDKERKRLMETFGSRLSKDILDDLVEKKVTEELKT